MDKRDVTSVEAPVLVRSMLERLMSSTKLVISMTDGFDAVACFLVLESKMSCPLNIVLAAPSDEQDLMLAVDCIVVMSVDSYWRACELGYWMNIVEIVVVVVVVVAVAARRNKKKKLTDRQILCLHAFAQLTGLLLAMLMIFPDNFNVPLPDGAFCIVKMHQTLLI